MFSSISSLDSPFHVLGSRACPNSKITEKRESPVLWEVVHACMKETSRCIVQSKTCASESENNMEDFQESDFPTQYLA